MKDSQLTFLRDTLNTQIARIKTNTHTLKIPDIKSLKLHAPKMHYHLTPELFIQLENTSSFAFPHGTTILQPSEICIIPPNIPHFETIKYPSQNFLNVVTMFQATTFSIHTTSAQKPNSKNIRIKNALVFNSSHLQLLESCLNNIVTFYHAPDSFDIVNSLLLTALSIINNTLTQTNMPPRKGNYHILKCLDLIQAYLFEPKLNVKFLAHQLQLSPDYLSNLFATSQSETLIEYINKHRISIACDYLKNTSLNISEISRACGYRDPAYFARIFKKTYQISPKQYRII